MKRLRRNFVLLCCLYAVFFMSACIGFVATELPEPRGNPDVFVKKGVQYMREYDAGDSNALFKAIAAFQLASQINSELPEVQDGLGCIAFREGRYDAADSFFDRAIQLDPAYARAWVNKAYLAELRGEVDLAEKHLREALRVNGFDVHALNNLAGVIADHKPLEEKNILEAQSLIFRADELSQGQSEVVQTQLKLFKERVVP